MRRLPGEHYISKSIDEPTDHQPPEILRASCISDVTAWRWRRKGWLATVNICGRQYITSEAVAEFLRRAGAGEFAKVHTTPRKSA